MWADDELWGGGADCAGYGGDGCDSDELLSGADVDVLSSCDDNGGGCGGGGSWGCGKLCGGVYDGYGGECGGAGEDGRV